MVHVVPTAGYLEEGVPRREHVCAFGCVCTGACAHSTLASWLLRLFLVAQVNHAPFAKVTSCLREIEVSNWGNIAVEEHYDLVSSSFPRQHCCRSSLCPFFFFFFFLPFLCTRCLRLVFCRRVATELIRGRSLDMKIVTDRERRHQTRRRWQKIENRKIGTATIGGLASCLVPALHGVAPLALVSTNERTTVLAPSVVFVS